MHESNVCAPVRVCPIQSSLQEKAADTTGRIKSMSSLTCRELKKNAVVCWSLLRTALQALESRGKSKCGVIFEIIFRLKKTCCCYWPLCQVSVLIGVGMGVDTGITFTPVSRS